MFQESPAKRHWSFWTVCIVGLLWNIGGAINYLMQTDPEWVSSMPATHQAIIVGRPAWATGGFAVGVFGGAIGCLFLLFRLRASFYIFLASLAGIMLTMVHSIDVAVSEIRFGMVEIIVMIVLPLVVALALALYAGYATGQRGR